MTGVWCDYAAGWSSRSLTRLRGSTNRTVCEVKQLRCEGRSGTRGSQQPWLSSSEFHFSLPNGTYDPNCATTCVKTCKCMHACETCFQNTGGIILHNIHTTTSSSYRVGVWAECLTRISACICASKHVHELTCKRWVPGVWIPAETRGNSITCPRWRPRAVNGVSAYAIHKQHGQVFQLPEKRKR